MRELKLWGWRYYGGGDNMYYTKTRLNRLHQVMWGFHCGREPQYEKKKGWEGIDSLFRPKLKLTRFT